MPDFSNIRPTDLSDKPVCRTCSGACNDKRPWMDPETGEISIRCVNVYRLEKLKTQESSNA